MNRSRLQRDVTTTPAPRQTLGRGQTFAVLLVGALLVGAIAVPYTDYWRESRFKRATVTQLERERATHPADPLLLFYLGKRLSDEGRNREAATIFQKAAESDPNDARIRDEWTQALLLSGQGAQAMAQLKQFAAAHPADSAPFLLLGKLHATLGADMPAQTALEQATRLNPNEAEAWTLLGDIHHQHARDDKATEALRHAVALTPNNPAVLLSLGRALTDADPKGAVKAYQKALILSPEDTALRREWAEFLYNHGDREKAEAEARETLRQNPEQAGASLLLGRCLLDRGATTEARAPLEVAASQKPFDTISARYLQRLFTQNGDKAFAATWEKEYIAREAVAAEGRRLADVLLNRPADRDTNRKMARYQAKLGNVEACIHHMAIALKAPLDAPAVLSAVADDLEAEGHSEAAKAMRDRISVNNNSTK